MTKYYYYERHRESSADMQEASETPCNDMEPVSDDAGTANSHHSHNDSTIGFMAVIFAVIWKTFPDVSSNKMDSFCEQQTPDWLA